ncbi:heavy-metal-associated domain-containing protein [Psychroflexus maritimus]|uniref:Heavy-metal-associated domain-containing protein n=1 Tax=Psychroflexus maritimus TaxID=2714865 RepID=A0A967AEJ8_9FLAO|nr:heavy-metal-associated domain-containing protein [Psychroflexus maritimus]NGZ89056.1 heavy-metal-associated domain-containing protein [Psychroflexus maritimus]
MRESLIIQNLKCGGCASTVIKQLENLEGVSKVDVEVELSQVNFDLQANYLMEEVKIRLKKIGYPVEGEANSFGSKAKSYISCATGKMSE